MDLNYSLKNIFPSPIHSIDIGDFDQFKNKIIEEIYQERDRDSIGRKVSNYGGWQSQESNVNECKLETLKEIIIESLAQFNQNLFLDNVSMVVFGWANINGPGNFNVKHCHPRSNLSGVFWIKVPKNSGNLVFSSPHLFSRYQELDLYRPEFYLNFNSHWKYPKLPEEGQILIFSSDLEHEVEENMSDEDRISYSFNIRLSL